ncbi:MAG TPA: hypothetical protein VKA87_10535 [Nitrososphaeraceae archaeon]|nr:hypothetical protein [Nitrososphaeraceae archaeon]
MHDKKLLAHNLLKIADIVVSSGLLLLENEGQRGLERERPSRFIHNIWLAVSSSGFE